MQAEGLITKAIHGLPELGEIKKMAAPYKHASGSLFILDDAFFSINETVEALFTQIGHHNKISVIFISQRLYHQNARMKTLSLNSHYLVLFPQKRDKRQISTFAHQVSPHRPRFVIEAFEMATKKPYSYLFCDFTQAQSPALMFRSNIFTWESPMSVYIERTKR